MNTAVDSIRRISVPLRANEDLQTIVDAVGDAALVLLGEASHGTSEFYSIRAEISKRLIEQKGFSFIAVEGDWPSCYDVNRYIKQYSEAYGSAEDVMQQFKRWPSWMWANQEIIPLIEWLKAYNSRHADSRQIGFYGLDVYSLWESMEEIIRYLEHSKAPQSQLDLARKAFSCFEPYGGDEQRYGLDAWLGDAGCEDEVVKLLQEMSRKQERHGNQQAYQHDKEAIVSAELNALVAVHAEQYYRSMIHGGPDSWNVRDRHMTEALRKIADFHGNGAKAIVWEHNTHIGDARATDMAEDGMVNVGQLTREQWGADQVFAIGFGTHRGTVIAGDSWGAPSEVMPVPAAMSDSWEDLFHKANPSDQMLIFSGENSAPFAETRGHRAIGVVYHPAYERGNYVPTRLSKRYDAFIYIDKSTALHPIVKAHLSPEPSLT